MRAAAAWALASTWLPLVHAGQDIDGNTVATLGEVVPIDAPGTYWTELHSCPVSCDKAGSVEEWTVFPSMDWLARCDQPLLFETAIYTPIDETPASRLRACTAAINSGDRAVVSEQPAGIDSCQRKFTKSNATISYGQAGPASLDIKARDGMLQAVGALEAHLAAGAACNRTILFGYGNGTVAGLYAGPSISKTTISAAIAEVIADITANGIPGKAVAQLCGGQDGRNSQEIFGLALAADAGTGTKFVQEALASWAKAKCVMDAAASTPLAKVQVMEASILGNSSLPVINSTIPTTNFTRAASKRAEAAQLYPRADCRVEAVYAGDSCSKIAQRCGISLADFNKYNPDPTTCNPLQQGGRVCCSAGSLPDIRPEPEAPGECRSYVVQKDEPCAVLAAKFGIKVTDIEKWNSGKDRTWGWLGCGTVYAGTKICLSEGNPPMPAPMANAVCGPTAPLATRPTDGTPLKDALPCPLNACCNVWGQCGITQDFCVENKADSGNPGTSKSQNGCVSSCGMDIVNNANAPAKYGRVGYYESWNFRRPCLTMRASDSNVNKGYTIMHWAFAEINMNDFTVKIVDDFNQWDKFKALRDVKKVISFGGWAYSNEQPSYDNLRQAMSPANRKTFAANIASFLNKNNLDGVDFDWEYPGADDIPGTPAGSPSDGANYAKFLGVMKDNVPRGPNGKTISIAAPSSFWYLKNFPIKEMAKHIDYIVYMTYDLHVTKAGVPASMIYVGESSYGRSFKMAQSGCTGPDCLFLGGKNASPAKKGRCTETAGYISNAEIAEIILDGGSSVNSWYDQSSDSDMLVYEDWAVDLQDFNDADLTGTEEDIPEGPTPSARPECKANYGKIEDIPTNTDDYCKDLYILEVLQKTLSSSLTNYDTLVNGGYQKKFNTYADAVVKSGNSVVEHFMFTKGNDYFQCEVTERYACKEWCYSTFPDNSDVHCRYYENYKCWDSAGCETPDGNLCEVEFKYRNITGGCPPDYSLRSEFEPDWGFERYAQASVYWSFRAGKEAQFYVDLYTDTGISKEDITWKNINRYECTPSDKDCRHHNHDYNFPVTQGYTRSDVLDPKTTVEKARKDLNTLGPSMSSVTASMRSRTYYGSSRDVVDAVSLPVTMVEDAVASMQKIDDTVDKWDADKRKAIILGFLTAIFFFVPVIGQIAGSVAALANVARIAIMAGTVGNVALGIYEIIDDPKNAPLAIFGIILEPFALMDIAKVSKAARARRAMSADDLKALGAKDGGKINAIDKVIGACKVKSKREVDVPFGTLPMSSLRGLQYEVPIEHGLHLW
ncbi:hypothetical protein Micbo1qcDRAFT_127692 [Microdochium bolleyi]|uniref:chitinase n=1 Tax=Microdochium bolleyi TaxID=196109 RepID=A0A136IL04_9PEZI|nr:hypothetical protein Micbo1qcDRAFT_127692 [Microdochium bolleyi]